MFVTVNTDAGSFSCHAWDVVVFQKLDNLHIVSALGFYPRKTMKVRDLGVGQWVSFDFHQTTHRVKAEITWKNNRVKRLTVLGATVGRDSIEVLTGYHDGIYHSIEIDRNRIKYIRFAD